MATEAIGMSATEKCVVAAVLLAIWLNTLVIAHYVFVIAGK
jgi:hypothetical protein